MKISDFGLTREGTVYQMDPRKRVPIRWLAPETLRTAMYTQKTDVFSFGIMCWEIFANGQEPYPGFTVAEVNVRVSGLTTILKVLCCFAKISLGDVNARICR